MTKRAFTLVWLVVGLGGCGSPAATTSDQPVASVSEANTIQPCGLGCPGGFHQTNTFCNLNCPPNNCFNDTASTCDSNPSCGSFTQCGTACPSGFFLAGTSCNLNCPPHNCFSNNASTCTSISQPCCPCAGLPRGGTNDRGAFNGQHFVELFASFSSSNPSMGSASLASCSCAVSFTIGQAVCNGVSTPVGVSFSSSTQVNITLPTSSVSRSCVVVSSSQNTQFIEFDFTTPPDP